MALPIRDICTLTGEAARRFIAEAKKNEANPHSKAFSEEYKQSFRKMIDDFNALR